MRLKERRKTIVYRTLNIKTKKIENAPEQEVENELKEIKKAITFFTLGKYGSTEIKFANEELAAIHSTKHLKTEG